MVLQLIRNELGNYVYKDPRETSTPPITSQEFEAYTGGDKTTLAGTTDLGSQTQALMRETPGQTKLVTDPVTGETKLDNQITPTKVEQKDFAPPSAQELIESPLQKAARIAQQFPMQQQTGPGQDEVFSLIRDQQKLAQRAQKLDQISQVADIGFRAYNLFKGGGTGPIPGTTGTMTPLSGGAFGTQSGFMAPSSAAGALGAGAIAYGIGDTFKVKGKKGMAAGATIGTAVGGPVGGVIGGVVGGVVDEVLGCFLPDTLITMADESKKKIIDIDIKDNIKIGGFVFATGKFLVNDIYDYKGIKVSGSHLVQENGNWLKVKDSKISKLISTDDTIVYTLGSKNRRILINDTLFTDYFDIDEQKTLAA